MDQSRRDGWRTRARNALLCLAAVVACDGSPGDTGDSEPRTVCLEQARRPTGSCAIVPVGTICSRSSNPGCAVPTLVEVSAPTPGSGPCLRLVLENNCSKVLYSLSCIELGDREGGETEWQCWTSSSLPGIDVDVDQCDATGSYRQWWSLDSDELDAVEPDCYPSR